MSDLSYAGVKGYNFKCFGSWQGFDSIRSFNIIIGRNNAGKSALLDLITQACTGLKSDAPFQRQGQNPQLKRTIAITEKMIEDTINSKFEIHNVYDAKEYAKKACIGMRIETTLVVGQSANTRYCKDNGDVADRTALLIAAHLNNKYGDPLAGHIPVRLRADRDIRPESQSECDHVGEDGQNATRLIERYLNQTGDHALVEKSIVEGLNTIMRPDWTFTRIFPKRDKSGQVWEINMEDETGYVVPLSHCGSGVKTLLLVLTNLFLVPHAKKKPLDRFIFCFEELENNLHPAVQRRLFRFLRAIAERDQCKFFVTTHSNTVIDLFSQDQSAQLLHVVNDRKMASVRQVSTYMHQCNVLDDLDVRASDLLQANCLIWVEGPSDRLYINKWIELWTGGELKEQTHYQCVWYGGALLAGITFNDETPVNALVAALRVNRRAIVVMDSDRKKAKDALKTRVQRVCNEVGKPAIAWVTGGREIENYIPLDCLKDALGNRDLKAISAYDDVFKRAGVSRDNKVELAHKVVKRLTKKALAATLDLGAKLDLVCQAIRTWNGAAEDGVRLE